MSAGDVVLNVTKVATTVTNQKVNVAPPSATQVPMRQQTVEFAEFGETGSSGWSATVDRLVSATSSFPAFEPGKSYEIKITEV